MKYYATIYIDELFEEEMIKYADFTLLKESENWGKFVKQLDFTHAFLGLTKGKSPDELDKQDEILRQEKLKNADWKDFDKKWYENLENNHLR